MKKKESKSEELFKRIKTGSLRYCKLDVQVKVLDKKSLFGKEYLLISPVAGSGKAWVQKRALLPVK